MCINRLENTKTLQNGYLLHITPFSCQLMKGYLFCFKTSRIILCNILEILHMCKTGRQLLYRAASGTGPGRTLVLLVNAVGDLKLNAIGKFQSK